MYPAGPACRGRGWRWMTSTRATTAGAPVGVPLACRAQRRTIGMNSFMDVLGKRCHAGIGNLMFRSGPASFVQEPNAPCSTAFRSVLATNVIRCAERDQIPGLALHRLYLCQTGRWGSRTDAVGSQHRPTGVLLVHARRCLANSCRIRSSQYARAAPGAAHMIGRSPRAVPNG